jgi:hypothetical protein
MAKFHDMCDRGRGQLSDRIQGHAPGTASGAGPSSAAAPSGGGMGIGGGAPGVDQPPLPEGWEQKQDGLKTVYVNAKLKARQETRPYCSRESLGQLLSAIDQLHNDTRSSSALSVLARSLGQKIVKPELGRKATVMLLGNGLGPQTFVETYTGQPIKHTGLGTTGYFTIVSKGASREIEKGDSALQRFHEPQRLRKIQGMDRSIAAEQVMSPKNRLAARLSNDSPSRLQQHCTSQHHCSSKTMREYEAHFNRILETPPPRHRRPIKCSPRGRQPCPVMPFN